MNIKQWSIWDRLFQIFVKRSLTVLTVIFLAGIILMLSLMLRHGDKVSQQQAVAHVKATVEFLQTARSFYSDHVVSQVDEIDAITITHNPIQAGTIPLPATFMQGLSGSMDSANASEMQFRLYSDYPFPWRKQQGTAQDTFEAVALEQLKQNPDQPFMQFEKQGKRKVLRYAEAQVLQPSCISCHNTYPGTPKTDWKVGDVRGVLSVTQPLASSAPAATGDLSEIFVLMVGISSLGAIGLSSSIRRLRRYSILLEQRVAIRQQAMEQAFTQIHNGPLQTLAMIIRDLQGPDHSSDSLHDHLQNLNAEIRAVGQNLTTEAAQADMADGAVRTIPASLRLGDGSMVDLERSLHEILYDVFSLTLKRPLPYFSEIKVKVRDFAPIDAPQLTVELKREICLWLEEALCNVGKHGKGAKRIMVLGKHQAGEYCLSVQDNGTGMPLDHSEGQGSTQAQKLAQRLGGDFSRSSLPNGGVICTLSWPTSHST